MLAVFVWVFALRMVPLIAVLGASFLPGVPCGMGKHIEFIARGLLRVDGATLVCEAVEGGYAYLPGGHIEFREDAKTALAREFMEETGLRVRVGALVGVWEGSFQQNGKKRHEVNLVFHVEPSSRKKERPLVESREEGIAFRWITPAQARRADLRPRAARSLLTNPSESVQFKSDMT